VNLAIRCIEAIWKIRRYEGMKISIYSRQSLPIIAYYPPIFLTSYLLNNTLLPFTVILMALARRISKKTFPPLEKFEK